MKLHLLTAATLVVALAACDASRTPDTASTPTPAADAPAPAAPAADTATSPDVADAAPAPPAATAMPAEGAISFSGFGPAAFGATEEEVRMSWGADLGSAAPSEPGGCYYLIPQPQTGAGYRIAFMIEGDRFSRLDVRASDIVAPGGGRIGMKADDIAKLYPGRVETHPHKYVEGAKNLRVKADAGGNGVLVFETGADGAVTRWRVGVPPQVDYVEGCS
jgi:hypothetical protein